MLACNCLNVQIETEPDDFQNVTATSLDLTEEECKDVFFKQEFQQIGKLININKIHAGLIHTRNVGSWVINQCINCDVNTHALHREKGASCVLVNSQLLTGVEITKLKNSELYSSTFHIIVYNSDRQDNIEDLHVDSYLPKEVQNTLRGLKEITTETLKKETLAVEDRIKKFAEQQYTALENLKDKTFREQEALIRIILSKTSEKSQVPEISNTMASPASNPMAKVEPLSHKNFNFKISDDKFRVSSRHTPQRQKSSPGVQSNSVMDYEVLFDFDGQDNINDEQDLSEVEESDHDDDIESHQDSILDVSKGSVKVPRSRTGSHGSVAKSLPVNIPVFMSQLSSHESEDVDEKLPSDENVDIAASIKALAQSVHGDAIFGDLPRPRFSTQI